MKNYKEELLKHSFAITEISTISRENPFYEGNEPAPLKERIHVRVKFSEEWVNLIHPVDTKKRDFMINLMYEKIYNQIYGKQENVIT